MHLRRRVVRSRPRLHGRCARGRDTDAEHDAPADGGTSHDTGVDSFVDPCTDGVKDGNETGVDCGGEPARRVASARDAAPTATARRPRVRRHDEGVRREPVPRRHEGRHRDWARLRRDVPRLPGRPGLRVEQDCLRLKAATSRRSCATRTSAMTARRTATRRTSIAAVGPARVRRERRVRHGRGLRRGRGVRHVDEEVRRHRVPRRREGRQRDGRRLRRRDLPRVRPSARVRGDADCPASDGCDASRRMCDSTLCGDGARDGNETGVDCGGRPARRAGSAGLQFRRRPQGPRGVRRRDAHLRRERVPRRHQRTVWRPDIDCGGSTCPGLAGSGSCPLARGLRRARVAATTRPTYATRRVPRRPSTTAARRISTAACLFPCAPPARTASATTDCATGGATPVPTA